MPSFALCSTAMSMLPLSVRQCPIRSASPSIRSLTKRSSSPCRPAILSPIRRSSRSPRYRPSPSFSFPGISPRPSTTRSPRAAGPRGSPPTSCRRRHRYPRPSTWSQPESASRSFRPRCSKFTPRDVVYRPLRGNPLRAPLNLASRRGEIAAPVRNFIGEVRAAARQICEGTGRGDAPSAP